MHQDHAAGQSHRGHSADQHPYRRLLVMAGISFLSMFLLMYAMIDVLGNLYVNLNQFYMAGLMTGPMVLLELLLMGSMYENKRLNALIFGATVIASLSLYMLIRQQAGISDREFLRSMIPHHAGAILMCERASIEDPEIVALCDGIRAGQQQEIDLMKAKLAELDR